MDHKTIEIKEHDTSDLRVVKISPLISPALLLEEIPISPEAHETVVRGRKEVADIINDKDDRVFVVIGPCSIHDTDLAIDYATRLTAIAKELKENLLIVMRVYFEKPRTTVGWKGLINDPDLDGSFKINKGLRKGRKLLNDINSMVCYSLYNDVWFLCALTVSFSFSPK